MHSLIRKNVGVIRYKYTIECVALTLIKKDRRSVDSHSFNLYVLLSFQLHPIESPDFGQLTRVQGLATPNQLAVSCQF